MSTCNRLDLQTLGSPPIMLKNLPDHWLPYKLLVKYRCTIRKRDYTRPTHTLKYSSWPGSLSPKVLGATLLWFKGIASKADHESDLLQEIQHLPGGILGLCCTWSTQFSQETNVTIDRAPLAVDWGWELEEKEPPHCGKLDSYTSLFTHAHFHSRGFDLSSLGACVLLGYDKCHIMFKLAQNYWRLRG
jgi:hypothetical protein